MKQNTNQTEKIQKRIILTLILGIIAIGLIGFYAFSKYIASVEGEGEAQIAKWSFKVNGTDITTTETINLAMTVDPNNNVVQNKVAPGTTGSFQLDLDGSESEVAIAYEIELDLSDKPKNLILYGDGTYKKPVAVSADGSTGTLKGFIMLNDDKTKQKKTETIYWKWPYETPTPEGQEKSNDEIDTEDSKKENMTIGVTVTATQTLEEPTPTLADYVAEGKIKVGDYVNYKAVKEEDVTALGSYTQTSEANDLDKYVYIAETGKTGYASNQTFKATNNLEWRVLHVNEDKTVELIPDNTDSIGKLNLNEEAGFVNAEEVLKKIGEIYGHGKGAVKGRSIKIKDIEKYSSFVPDYASENQETVNKQMITVTNSGYAQQKFYEETKDEEGNITYKSTPTVINRGGTIEIRNTYYYHSNAATEKSYFQTNEETKAAYDVIFKTKSGGNKATYWLASRCASPESSYCDFLVRFVNSGYVTALYLFGSFGDTNGFGYAVCPVVTLDSNIQMKQDTTSGVWNLKTDGN